MAEKESERKNESSRKKVFLCRNFPSFNRVYLRSEEESPLPTRISIEVNNSKVMQYKLKILSFFKARKK